MPSSRYYKFKIENQKEKKRRLKILFFTVFASSVFLAIVWLIFISPLFQIKNIEVSDSKYLSNISLAISDNLLTLSRSRLKSELSSAIPSITNIEITKKLFHTVKINFQERVQIGIWCNELSCYYFDKEGIAFKEAPQTEGGLILKVTNKSNGGAKLGDNILDSNKTNFVTTFSNKINSINNGASESNQFKILEFKIKPTLSVDLEALTDKNWSIYLDEKQNPESSASNLIAILEESIKNIENLEYIDLRIPSRIFYKLK